MLNYLGNLAELIPPPGSVPGFAGGNFGGFGRNPLERFVSPIDQMGGINSALAQNQDLARQQQAMEPPKKRGGGLGNFLGRLGDALLIANGAEPMYEPRQRQKRMGEALSQFFADDPRLAQIMRDDPKTGVALYKTMHKDVEKPAFYRELEAAGFGPDEIRSIMKRRYSRPIIVGSPTTGYGVLEEEGDEDGGAPAIVGDGNGGGGGGGGDLPTVNSQADYDALPPGTHYRDSQGNEGIKRGGPTASPSANFP